MNQTTAKPKTRLDPHRITAAFIPTVSATTSENAMPQHEMPKTLTAIVNLIQSRLVIVSFPRAPHALTLHP